MTVRWGAGRGTDRQAWLAERRPAVAAVYDGLASAYDEHEYPWDLQREWVARVLRLIPPGGIVLDVPGGTGKYFPMVAAAGHQVAAVDQSAGMLRVRPLLPLWARLIHRRLNERFAQLVAAAPARHWIACSPVRVPGTFSPGSRPRRWPW
jgi:SAM-dependent methyltransferase